MENAQTEQKKEIDPFKDTLARYFGYANELGEAFRPLIPRAVVTSTYGIAAIYATADAVHKGRKAYLEAEAAKLPQYNMKMSFIEKFSETAVWQLLASVLIPPIFINRTCVITASLLGRAAAKRAAAMPNSQAWWQGDLSRRLLSSAAGLSVIPLIVHPIDHAVDWFVEKAYKPATASFFKDSHKPGN